MKNLLYLFALIITGLLLQLSGIWWLPALAALVIGFLMKDQSAMTAFALGFLGLFLLWAIWSAYSNSLNDGILASKIGVLFNGLSGVSLILITALGGGLLGGMASLTGKYVQQASE